MLEIAVSPPPSNLSGSVAMTLAKLILSWEQLGVGVRSAGARSACKASQSRSAMASACFMVMSGGVIWKAHCIAGMMALTMRGTPTCGCMPSRSASRVRTRSFKFVKKVST